MDKRVLPLKVGTISANGEREIGDMIAKAMEKVGKEGVITVAVRKCGVGRWSPIEMDSSSGSVLKIKLFAGSEVHTSSSYRKCLMDPTR